MRGMDVQTGPAMVESPDLYAAWFLDIFVRADHDLLARGIFVARQTNGFADAQYHLFGYNDRFCRVRVGWHHPWNAGLIANGAIGTQGALCEPSVHYSGYRVLRLFVHHL